jgi:hypothetical protein
MLRKRVELKNWVFALNDQVTELCLFPHPHMDNNLTTSENFEGKMKKMY